MYGNAINVVKLNIWNILKNKIMKANAPIKSGIELIAEERQRQIDVEGYNAQHDSYHSPRKFIHAANTYVKSADLTLHSKEYSPSDPWHQTNLPFYRNDIKRTWPFEDESFKPTTDIRDLVKAGALIAAAIDRLQMK